MNIEQDAALLAATRWYGTHRAEHLARDCDRMVDRCVDHLVSGFPIARSSAHALATQALADIESKTVPGFIDIDRSNSRMVLLRNSTEGTTHLITLPELFQLVQARQHPVAG